MCSAVPPWGATSTGSAVTGSSTPVGPTTGPAASGTGSPRRREPTNAGTEYVQNVRRNRRRRMSRKGRKNRRKKKQNKVCKSELILMHANVRGFLSKKQSIIDNVEKVSPDIFLTNEHGLRGKNKVNIPSYFSFTKCRESKQSGGCSISVVNAMKQETVKVKEGINDDEYIIVRIETFAFPINIVSYYGEQESRSGGNDKVLDKWLRFRQDIEAILFKGEEVIILGDFNKHIGNDHLGVKGNKPDITFGGRLVRDFLGTGDLVLINSTEKCIGGPFTREDPSGRADKSCLDLAMVSVRLAPFVKEMVIDNERLYAMNRVVTKNGKLTITPTDHYTVILKLVNLPSSMDERVRPVVWNLDKPGGWNSYKELTDSRADDIRQVVEDENNSVSDIYRKFNKIHTDIKFEAFGKTTVKGRKITKGSENKKEATKEERMIHNDEEEKAKSLLKKQNDQVEKEINDIKGTKHGNVVKVFKMVKK